MRIAFDIDGTLTPLGDGQFSSVHLPFPMRMVFREPLREGAIQLMRELHADGHDLWIYTSSLRSKSYIYLWFLLFGIRLGGAINGDTHSSAVRDRPARPSKFPPAFGIDLLIDDSAGVEIEGKAHGFTVLVVEPGDMDWAAKVRAAARGAA
jgi:hypothetical protein